MLDKEKLLRIRDCGIVAVVRAESSDQAQESLMHAWKAG